MDKTVKEEFLDSEEFKELKKKFPDNIKEVESLVAEFFQATENKTKFNFEETNTTKTDESL